MTDQDWNESRMYVMKSIENTETSTKEINESLKAIQQDLANIKIDVAKKGSLWGAISAVIVSIFASVFGGGHFGG